MIGTGILERVRRRDPDHRIALRALRLTLVALSSFYVCLYGIGNPVLATYAFFGAIAAGIFVQLPGSAPRRSGTLLAALPAAWALIALGTVLDANVWAAAAGTLVVGFAIAFFGVGGPRLVGLAGGLQLFFIVANFPTHHPNTLGARLIGASVGVVLTAVAETVLWPDPAPVPYQRRLAEAADAVAGLLDAAADVVAGRAAGNGEVARQCDRAARAIERTSLLGVPRTERPTSAGRRDRALRDGAAVTLEIAEQVRRFTARPELKGRQYADVAALMRQCAATMRRASRTLSCGRRPPGARDELAAVNPRPQPDTQERHPVDIDRLRVRTSLWTTVEHVDMLTVAVGIVTGQPTRFDDGRPPGGSDAFWYARHNEVSLYWRQLRVHLTPRSVYFQGALRLAVALTAARLIAGELNLSHGFWVLLGTLTVMRTSAVNTGTTLRSAVIGALIGAVVAGLLLKFAYGPPGYAVELSIATVLAFALGPLLGLAWQQAMLTVMVTLVFAQLSPTDWSLAGVRLTDLLLGGAVGILAGLVMWPKGAGGELGGRIGTYLRVAANLIEETVAALVDRNGRPAALHTAHREFVLADASLCQYYLERPDPHRAQVHWDATVAAGRHIVHGAELLMYHNPPGSLASWPEAAATLTDIGHQLRGEYLDIARDLSGARIPRPVATPADAAAIGGRVRDLVAASGSRPEDAPLVEVEDWLINLSENLDWINAAPGHAPRAT